MVRGLVQKLITRAGRGCPKTDRGALLIVLEATVAATREATSQLDLPRMTKETIGVPPYLDTLETYGMQGNIKFMELLHG